MLALLLATAASAHTPTIFLVEPGEDWCRVANEVAGPADIIELSPGRWPGGCRLTRGGIPEKNESTLIRSADPDRPAVIEAVDGGAVVTVSAGPIRLYNLHFDGVDRAGPLLEVDAAGLTVDRCTFTGAGQGVVVPVSIASLNLLNNTFDVGHPAWSLGCRDGSCGLTEGVLRHNLVRGSGVEVTGTAEVLLFDDVVAPERGPALRLVGGATVRRTLAFGGGIELIGDGPWAVESSIVWGASPALAATEATGVTLHGVTVDGDVAAADDTVARSVAHRGGWSAPDGIDVVDCSAGGCFLGPFLPDPRPAPEGLLAVGADAPDADFCEGDLSTVGAVALGAAAPRWLAAEPKTVLCDPDATPPAPPDTGLPVHTGDTGVAETTSTSTDTGTPPSPADSGQPVPVTADSAATDTTPTEASRRPPPSGCGCEAGSRSSTAWWALFGRR